MPYWFLIPCRREGNLHALNSCSTDMSHQILCILLKVSLPRANHEWKKKRHSAKRQRNEISRPHDDRRKCVDDFAFISDQQFFLIQGNFDPLERLLGIGTSVIQSAGRGHRFAHRKRPMFPGPAVPGCCLVSFHFLWAILLPHTVQTGFTVQG